MKLQYLCSVLLCSILWFSTACKPTTPPSASALVTPRSGTARIDSVFLGYYFGMTHLNFMAHCREMNQKHILKDGTSGVNIQYKFQRNEFPSEAVMEFYPTFGKDAKIHAVPTDFLYLGWSPWNKELSADAMLPQVVALMEKWYGTGFQTSKTAMGETIYEKTELNRNIKISRLDERKVRVMLTDIDAK
jgi:hypothetical protein